MTYGNDTAPYSDGLLDPGEDMDTHTFEPTPDEPRCCILCGQHENTHSRPSTIPTGWSGMSSRERHAWARGDNL